MSTGKGYDKLASKLAANALGTRLFENEFFKADNTSDLYQVRRPQADAWEQQFPGLEVLIDGDKGGDSLPKVAIATEDIVGPVRNGGIGTTYYYLAKMLAANGIDVSILYMRGNHSEKETIQHWIDHYAALGISFVPIEDAYEKDNVKAHSQRWVRPIYNLYQYLKQHHYDIVHVSEWRGTSYMALLGKQLGLQFQHTEFVVKCSSPWLWNRLYGNSLIYNNADLTKMFFEKRSVEMGDRIVGGSAHLIRWMISQGYAVKKGDTFVQPNVLLTDHLQDFIDARTHQEGDCVEVSELVFFGRLEERKGIVEFCDAIDILIEEYPQAIAKVKKIAFMGKAGARLQSHPDLSIMKYIELRTDYWPDIEVTILTEYQQYEALSYLLSGDRLAVMPSRIENSSLAVYECLICGIPFIASNTGGTPELVREDHHDDVLFDTHPTRLAQTIGASLEHGAKIPHATFNNEQNNRTWIQFHKSYDNWKGNRTDTVVNDVPVSIVIYHLDQPARLKQTLKAIEQQTYGNFRVIVVDDGSAKPEALELLHELEQNDHIILLKVKYFGPGYAYNHAVSECVAEGSYIYFTRSGNRFESADSLQVFMTAAEASGACILTSFNFLQRDKQKIKEVDFIENQNFHFFKPPKHDIDLLIKADTFTKVGGYNSDPHGILETIELTNQVILNGSQCMTVPEFLYTYDEKTGQSRIKRGINFNSATFRVVRPYLIHSPNILNNILLVRDPSAKPKERQAAQVSSLLRGLRGRPGLRGLAGLRLPLIRGLRRGFKGLRGLLKRFYKRNRYRLAKFAHDHIKPAIRKYPALHWLEPPLRNILERYRARKRY